MKINQTDENAWKTVSSWVSSLVAKFNFPRQSDVIEFGKRYKLSARKTKFLLTRDFKEYSTGERPTFPTPRKHSRSYLNYNLSTVCCDLAFFGHKSPELGKIGATPKIEQSPCLIFVVVATRWLVAIPLGHGGKSAKSLVRALQKSFDAYREQYGVYPKRLLWDDEKAMSSAIVKQFLREKNCKLFTYKFSRTKSAFAENCIRILRAQLRKAFKASRGEGKWHQLLPDIVKGYNSRPLVMHGKKLSFAPRDISRKNFGKFLAQLEQKFQFYNFLSFTIDVSLFKDHFRYPIGSRVVLKKRAISLPGLGAKLSETPLLDKVVWQIVGRAVYISKAGGVIPVVYLESEEVPPRVTTPEEQVDFLQQVSCHY